MNAYTINSIIILFNHPENMTKHFLQLKDISNSELCGIIDDAIARKKDGTYSQELEGKSLALIFEKSSTRTRVSFEVAMNQLGGKASFLSIQDLQLGRGEPLEDTARVISSMVDGIVLRTLKHKTLSDFASFSSSPVINGLTDLSHPCQLLADLMTFKEKRGPIEGKKVTWVGDYNNMCRTYIEASHLLGFNLNILCPEELQPDTDSIHSGNIFLTDSIEEALKDSDLVTTDVWISMGEEQEKNKKENLLKDYRVSPSLLDLANKEVIFLHCLPAIRGQEISEDMLDDPRSFVWDQAENRLHAQKSLLVHLMKD